MSSTPLTCCSIGSATVSITVLALAPGYRVVTCTVGGTTSGYCATASRNRQTPPIRTIRIAMTLERTGRSMKNFEIMARLLLGRYWLGFDLFQLRIDLLAGNRAQQPGGDDAVVGLQAFFDDAQLTLQRPDPHLALLDDIFAVHDQQIASGLIAAERDIRHEQRVLLLIDRDPDADKEPRQ